MPSNVPQRLPPLTLASASPRRSELLSLTGWDFTVFPVEIDETPRPNEAPADLARRLAVAKARRAAARGGQGVLITADTVVFDGRALLGKPEDVAQARAMLLSLRGRRHLVLSALVLLDLASTRDVVDVCQTTVPMRAYSEDEVRRYVAGGSPMDKAGAYGIQDEPFRPVELDHLEGCFTNVMGLPLCRLVRGMRSLGWEPPVDAAADCPPDPGRGACRVPHLLGLAG